MIQNFAPRTRHSSRTMQSTNYGTAFRGSAPSTHQRSQLWASACTVQLLSSTDMQEGTRTLQAPMYSGVRADDQMSVSDESGTSSPCLFRTPPKHSESGSKPRGASLARTLWDDLVQREGFPYSNIHIEVAP